MGICTWGTETYQQVAALTNLQHFTFSSPILNDNYGCSGPPHDLEFGYTHEPYLHSAFFKTLTNLTHLELRISAGPTGRPLLTIDGSKEHNNAIQHLSCLVKLQTLIIQTVASQHSWQRAWPACAAWQPSHAFTWGQPATTSVGSRMATWGYTVGLLG
jgi:hypothetical protein